MGSYKIIIPNCGYLVWGLLILIFRPIGVRVWAELMIVIFNINDNPAKIKDYFYNKK
ncbi:MAG: DUF4282 domain-containing protein [Catonella sp.]|uniref:DUF4282 domain-containing protein n=1 Tax=Catonella sp. TaxID=2382125 RepID=UPI003FA163A3